MGDKELAAQAGGEMILSASMGGQEGHMGGDVVCVGGKVGLQCCKPGRVVMVVVVVAEAVTAARWEDSGGAGGCWG